MNRILLACCLFTCTLSCAPSQKNSDGVEDDALRAHYSADEGTIAVYREGREIPLLVQHAREGVRPYIHPIMAPDGVGEVTEYSPEHHRHQTGIFWGLKKVNGRDFFMNWKEDYWRRLDAHVITQKGNRVQWQTSYQLLDENGEEVMTETQTWSMEARQGQFVLDLHWVGEAAVDVTMEKFYVGGLFVRMPWKEGIAGEVINSGGQRNGAAEGQRALWNDIGIQLEGRQDFAHIAIFDHPDNPAFPHPWRVDHELGVGPSKQILGDWSLGKGAKENFKFRLLVYTGEFKRDAIQSAWKSYVCD